jgi:hypothetical protein
MKPESGITFSVIAILFANLNFLYLQEFGMSGDLVNYVHAKQAEIPYSNWINYTDPEGKFMLQYPDDWNSLGREVKGTDLTLVAPGGFFNGLLTVKFQQFPSFLTSALKNMNISEAFPEFLTGFSTDFPDFKKIGEANYSKYTIDEQKAASQAFSSSFLAEEGYKHIGIVVWAVVDQQPISVVFGSNQSEFNKVIPTVNKIIHSIRITNGR